MEYELHILTIWHYKVNKRLMHQIWWKKHKTHSKNFYILFQGWINSSISDYYLIRLYIVTLVKRRSKNLKETNNLMGTIYGAQLLYSTACFWNHYTDIVHEIFTNYHYLLTPTKTYFQNNKKEYWRQIDTIMTPQSPFTLLAWKKIHRKSIVTEAVRP